PHLPLSLHDALPIYIPTAFSASCTERRCGVVTTIPPSTTTDCASDSGTSPVPGGRSTTSTSSSGQTTPRENCLTALLTIGPLQTDRKSTRLNSSHVK